MTDFSKPIIRSNRREFIAGSAAAILLASGLSVRAQGAKTIKIGFISPVSGPLAAFGQGERSIARLFVSELGVTPHDFIEGVRLDQARMAWTAHFGSD